MGAASAVSVPVGANLANIMSNENCYALSALLTEICSWPFTQNVQRLGNCTHCTAPVSLPARGMAGRTSQKKASAFCL